MWPKPRFRFALGGAAGTGLSDNRFRLGALLYFELFLWLFQAEICWAARGGLRGTIPKGKAFNPG